MRLTDGSLFVVIRKDGGDGVPRHSHVPYVFASSKDSGHTWTITEVSFQWKNPEVPIEES